MHVVETEIGDQYVAMIIFLHCKKERVIMTNLGHVSCTQYCCEPLSKEWKNVPAHKLVTEYAMQEQCLCVEQYVFM